ncbi:sialidase family protein [Paraflavitalea devenefica]|uniref:six-hairpin glycosidase n=1 Tax=Paraflavitalea devenefica TaxID=2716334 RepID=UPI001ABB2880|nr:six-hairpin glycosidase [Paraflavitalea devenefica]
MITKHKLLLLLLMGCAVAGQAQQDTVRYTGSTLVKVDYHDGRLPLAMGVHNIQVVRAHRDLKEARHSFGWTYNHAPMLAYWNNTFYLEYLSNPVGEHVPPGQTLLVTSKDGYRWSDPVIIFPPYKVPDGFKKPERKGVANNLYAVMHQRMGFYTAFNKKLLALAYYGIAMDNKDDPNDGNGIGRVVREIKADGSYGPIYFIRYNHDFNEKNSTYPFYKSSKDKAFVAACDELLSKPLMMQQWNEEADRNDPLIPVKKEYKALSFYHLPDGRAVGLWKHALTSISTNDGKSWLYNPLRAPGFVNSNAKIWGQRTSDGKYATVYNPSEFRWPLALSLSDDGLHYNNLLLVNGEISPMRYGGNYKSYGPQYVRGIQEGDGIPPDGKLWVTYSMNKEDIWIASVPVPVRDKETKAVEETFAQLPAGEELQYWNIYSPVWAPVSVEQTIAGEALVLKDGDAHDYARAERLLPAAAKMQLEFSVTPTQANHGQLDIELQDALGEAGVRFTFGADSTLQSKSGARYRTLLKYTPGTTYHIRVNINTAARMYTMNINGKDINPQLLFAPLHTVERIVFRTGEVRRFPTPDTPADNFTDLPDAGKRVPEAVYSIGYLKAKAQ